ncbi:FecR domain-containing protein [Chitinophaga pendula]|uniref:FecR family protein n=1 Tax=Chitinophaga TaxID=79328 RepID=UPI000BB0BA82|nr:MULTISPECIES: FecR domain-containing protein [Chitinophaga]ASZ14151.1 hypothetical protein CK934_25980 [Chitinophaga sp. MD30]UCJ08212.1 FecR domain-containing protein [Chitinophaga pendula]
MNISQLNRIIRQYLNGHANEKETALIDRWLDESLETARQQAVTTQSEQHRLAVWQELQGAINMAAPAGRLVWLKRWRTVAAACVLIIAGSAGYYYRYTLQDIVSPIPMEYVSASSFQVRRVTLPDSTIVVLNSGSEVSYPRYFRGPQRRVVLNGEAYFDVQQDASSSFRISGPHLRVKVLGTAFTVTDSDRQTAARVSVHSGRVAVSAGTGNFATRQIGASQELIYHSDSNAVAVQEHTPEATEWISKQFIFSDCRLSVVINEIATKYNVSIRLADPKTGQLAFTGAFEANDTLQDMLNIISLSYRLKVERLKDGTIMIR